MRNRRRITSIKPGRAPSFMGGVGSIIAVLFGLFWTLMASQMTRGIGGPIAIFPLFGVIFMLVGVMNAIYSFRQATGKDRYSILDVTDSDTEPDPLNERFGRVLDRGEDDGSDVVETLRDLVSTDGETELSEDTKDATHSGRVSSHSNRFCPYCGKEIDDRFAFCPSCGKELPK